SASTGWTRKRTRRLVSGARLRLGPTLGKPDLEASWLPNGGRMCHHDHRVLSAVDELEVSGGEALLVALPKRAHDVATVVAVPFAGLEPPPLDVWIELCLEGGEVSSLPGLESISGQGHGLFAHQALLSSSVLVPTLAHLARHRGSFRLVGDDQNPL